MAKADQANQSRSSIQSASIDSRESIDTTKSKHKQEEPPSPSSEPRPAKNPVHRIHAPGSVQALTADDDVLFAGTQGGSIVVWSLETYDQLAVVPAHQESVLSLALSEDKSLLFSTGADSIVNVWSTQTLQRLYSLYSHFEIGDIFCVVYSPKTQTLFWGAQNSSVQWYKLSTDAGVRSPTLTFSPGSRKHRFFDSLGPGGVADIISDEDGPNSGLHNQGGRVLTIPSRNYLPYAHKSYIYSMLLVKGLFTHDKDEEILITGGGDGTIKLWSIDTQSATRILPRSKFKNPTSNILSLSYKGSFLYAGLSDGTANIYNLASNQLVQKLNVGDRDRYNDHFTETESWQAADGKILAMALTSTPDHDMLVTGGNDNVVSFWEAELDAHISVSSSARSNDELLNALREFVAYRTVALNPTCVRDCHDAITFLRKQCNAFSATTTLLSPQEGVNPILLAKFPASNPSKSTRSVLFYGHYDVVDAEFDPSNPSPTWYADPFSLQPMNGFLYGRGVTDNKGPILAAIYAVADLVQHGSLSCNVTFLLEGDEEAGSRGFRKTVQSAHDAIGPVDFILLSNSYWLDDHIPCLTFGMRGVVHASVTISSNKPDLHSGMDGKSVQHEPLKDLTVLLAALVGPSGTKVTIPQFYDTVDDLSESEMQSYASITSSLLPGHPEIKNDKAFALSLMQRWRYPNLTVHRIDVPEAKTAVTISGSATATLSIRIVPSQTAEQIATSLSTYLHDQFTKLQSSNTLRVSITSKADPWLGDVSSEMYTTLKDSVVEAWHSDALGSSSGSGWRAFTFTPSPSQNQHATSSSPCSDASPSKTRTSHRRASSLASAGTFTPGTLPREPLFIREGGSIPALSFLEHEFHAPAAMFPMGQASDNAHLDNERMRVENLWKGRDVLKKVFARL
ncbi:uncharacterized protein Z518_03828 [Rhinocladiella mackenziei CBS 650.93]|uniref:Peptidase M20 dimerisation domain-containing protein n=1 Tax=Rhinocladiella mackenziei CBS 650.93 TaxID=1442369 RepID=A0A0D2J9Q7_9EURO|nr:uncharacterized protein Z518_03828 [Rhinocladiella mackenziei CBS 650.93]KIX05855.1 hypothetical protein Z518_03828 [Rhinocladiella mackenziei CBS 650.93]